MSTTQAILWIDHRSAQILAFEGDGTEREKKIRAHTHPTPQHGSQVRTEHEFFGAVCDGLAGIPQVLVVGPRTGLADFDRYARKHRPQTAERLVDRQVMDHPTTHQLAALARRFFEGRDARASSPSAS